MTTTAIQRTAYETDYSVAQVSELATVVYDVREIGGAISRGSFKTAGTVIAPYSIRTLSAIANSYDENLLVRAVDVTLKERRPLALVVREFPLHLGHLRLMTAVAEYGTLIVSPVPAFYIRPKTLEEIINQTVGRILNQFAIEVDIFSRWQKLRDGFRVTPSR